MPPARPPILAVVVMAIALGAGCREAPAPATAEAVIEIAQFPANPDQGADRAPDAAALADAAAAQQRLLASDDCLGEALRRLRAAGALPRPFAGEGAPERLRSKLTLEPGQEPPLLVVRLAGVQKDRPAETLRAVLGAYLDAAEEQHRKTWTARVGELRAACSALRAQLGALDKDLRDFLARHELLILDPAASEPAVRLASLAKGLQEKEQALAALEARGRALEDLRGRAARAADPAGTIAADADLAAAIRQEPGLVARERRAAALEGQLAELRRRFGPEADAVKETEADLATARRDLEAERRAAPARVLDQRRAVLALETGQARRAADALRRAADEARAQADAYAQRVQQYQDLQRRRDRAEADLAVREKERLRAVQILAQSPARVARWP
jgi:hypothetical protein